MKKPAKGKFKYRSYDTEDVHRAATTRSTEFDSYLSPGANIFKPKPGENRIRVLPRSWDDSKTWGRHWAAEIMVHYEVGGDNSTYLCLKNTDKGAQCPMCDQVKDAETEDQAKKLRAKKRALCYVIDRTNQKTGPMLWPMPVTLYNEINLRVEKISKTSGDIKIDDPEDGFDVSFNKEGEKDRTKYTGVEVDRDSSPLSNKEARVEAWLAAIEEKPAPDQLKFYDEDYIDKILSGGTKRKAKKADDDDEDEDEAPQRKKAKSKKPVDEDDEAEEVDEEDDSDADEDDDDEPKTKKGKSKKPADDDDEDDDDEDEAPARKKAKGKSKPADDDDEPEDDEAEDDDDDEDDDEDEPKGKKVKAGKSGKSKKPADDDDEEEVEVEDDDEAEEDDDEPKRGKGSTASGRAKERLAKLKKRRAGR